jgi:hypothetical protein
MHANQTAIAYGNAGTLLAPMLKGKKAKERQSGSLATRGIDPDDSTLFFGVIA